MRLDSLVTSISSLTDEELLKRLQEVRGRRMIERPAAKKHVERAEKKESRGKVSKVEDMFDNLSEQDKKALIAKLKGM